jgi:hypothetical protein
LVNVGKHQLVGKLQRINAAARQSLSIATASERSTIAEQALYLFAPAFVTGAGAHPAGQTPGNVARKLTLSRNNRHQVAVP